MNSASRSALLVHASLAVETSNRIEREIALDLESSLKRQGENAQREMAACIRRYRCTLEDRFSQLENSPAERLAAVWRSFLVAYDDYLEVVRQARCEMADAHYWNELGVPLHIPASGSLTH